MLLEPGQDIRLPVEDPRTLARTDLEITRARSLHAHALKRAARDAQQVSRFRRDQKHQRRVAHRLPPQIMADTIAMPISTNNSLHR